MAKNASAGNPQAIARSPSEKYVGLLKSGQGYSRQETIQRFQACSKFGALPLTFTKVLQNLWIFRILCVAYQSRRETRRTISRLRSADAF
jgi:hypothetical protein